MLPSLPTWACCWHAKFMQPPIGRRNDLCLFGRPLTHRELHYSQQPQIFQRYQCQTWACNFVQNPAGLRQGSGAGHRAAPAGIYKGISMLWQGSSRAPARLRAGLRQASGQGSGRARARHTFRPRFEMGTPGNFDVLESKCRHEPYRV